MRSNLDAGSIEAKLIGSWRRISLEPIRSTDRTQGIIKVYSENHCHWYLPGDIKSVDFQYRVDSSVAPSLIDEISEDGVSRGIFEFRGALLVMCFSNTPNSERPKCFSGSEALGWSVYTYEPLG